MNHNRGRENRRRRRRRNQRQLERMAHKRMDAILYRATGKSPGYYDVVYRTLKTVQRGSRRVFDVKRCKVKVVPNVAYHRMVTQLLKMAEGLTVQLPAEWARIEEALNAS